MTVFKELRRFERTIGLWFTLTVVLIIVMSTLSFLVLKTVVANHNQVVQNSGRDLLHVEELHLLAEKKISHSRAFFLSQNPKYRYEVEAREMEIERQLGALEENTTSPKGLELLQEVKATEEAHSVVMIELMNGSFKNGKDLSEMWERVVKPKRDELDAALTELKNHKQLLYQEAKRAAGEASKAATGLLLAGGIISCVVGIFLTVLVFKTLRQFRKHDEKLQESSSRSLKLTSSSIIGVVTFKLDDGSIVETNSAFQEMTGYSKEEILNTRGIFKKLTPEEWTKADEEAIAGLARTGVYPPYEKQLFRKDGQRLCVVVGMTVIEEGSQECICFVLDITAQKKAEAQNAELLKELSNYKDAFDEASIIATTDARGVITSVNDKFCEISKYSRSELIGKTHIVVNSTYHSKEFFSDLWRTITNGKTWRGEIKNRAKDGSFYWVDTVIVPFLGAGDRPFKYIAIRNDITKRKHLEDDLRSSLAARDEFLSIASHELKTPLTSLKVQVQMAARAIRNGNEEIYSKPRVDTLVGQAEKQLDRLTRLVDDILDVSRISTGNFRITPETFDLCALIRDLLERLRNVYPSTDIKFPVLEHCDPIEGFWDKIRIEQVVTNLASNAIKYGLGKEIVIHAFKRDGQVFLEVRDQGVGIPEEHLRRIFERFERAISASEVSGLGLGLYITKKIASAHGGDVWATSVPGKGSTFHVRLPLITSSG